MSEIPPQAELAKGPALRLKALASGDVPKLVQRLQTRVILHASSAQEGRQASVGQRSRDAG